jgi:hypothetical protein
LQHYEIEQQCQPRKRKRETTFRSAGAEACAALPKPPLVMENLRWMTRPRSVLHRALPPDLGVP